MNTLVSFELAKLLKEKRFEQEERPSYLLVDFSQTNVFKANPENIGVGDLIGYYVPNKTVNAPTIAEVVMWLYEKHNLWIRWCKIILGVGGQQLPLTFSQIADGGDLEPQMFGLTAKNQKMQKDSNTYKTTAIGNVLLCVVILCGCQKERYTYTEQKCVNGYYEEYWTGGRMINKPTMDANRLEKRWICTEYVTDTLIGYRWVWKK